ncbi:hypothetical protein AH04_227 [Erwinia phage AH04]|uniref:Uncharacterized protein n=1 Tax=Erwinia phage AH04 TaxID=2869569 RepID=A0AAE7X0S8_9CAUD|nr:hypothetical protein PQC02_gp087 [Erwinia phage AH04]QZA70702.1 hypothetical protein AH04_227 [Erwinia phage AH04]
MFNLTPELAGKSVENDIFFAVRSGNGKMVVAGQHGSMEVPGEGVKLGERFFNTPQGVIVRAAELDDYRRRQTVMLEKTVRVGKIAVGKIASYSQLRKKSKKRK